MLINKRLLFITLIVCIHQNLIADELSSIEISESKKNITFYAGINPLALIAFLPNGIGTIGTLWGSISGQEFGISIYGGMHFEKAHSLEIRFSSGPASYFMWDNQLQLGYIWYPLEQFLNWNGGLNAGFILRQFFWHHRISDFWSFSLTPELILGWRFIVNSLAFDLRCGWNITYFTWSNIYEMKSLTSGSPFPINFAFMAGIAWIFR
jgi:hypothetical protein